MNTERDNFYDWSKDKGDTGYAAFESTRRPSLQSPSAKVPWARIALVIVLGIAFGLLLKYLASR